MQVFEFLMVLVSIIVGLGIAALLTGVADLLRRRRDGRAYWLHSLLVALVFLAHAQTWWESWSLVDAAERTFLGLLLMLASPVCLFLVAHLLFPDSSQPPHLEAYYFEIAPVLWLLGACATLFGTLFRPIVFGEALFSPGNVATAPTLAICLVLASSSRRSLHSVLIPTLFVVIILDVLLVNPLLGQR